MAPGQESRQIGSHLQEHRELSKLAGQEPRGVGMLQESAIVAFLVAPQLLLPPCLDAGVQLAPPGSWWQEEAAAES